MLLPPDAIGIMPSDIESGGINRVVTIGVAVAANDFLAHFLQADALDRACGAGEIFLHKGGRESSWRDNRSRIPEGRGRSREFRAPRQTGRRAGGRAWLLPSCPAGSPKRDHRQSPYRLRAAGWGASSTEAAARRSAA